MANQIFTNRRDVHGVRLKDGDIVAEGKIGDTILDGGATIMRRPLGLVKVTPEGENLIPIRTGYVLINVKQPEPQVDEEGNPVETPPAENNIQISPLFLSMGENGFMRWEDVEKVGNVDSLPD